MVNRNYHTLPSGISSRVPGKLRKLFFLIPVLLGIITARAQITGSAFRDFNGNGTRENTSGTFVEPLAPGIIVTAYDNNDAILASYTTSGTTDPNYTIPASGAGYNGTKGSGTGFVPNGTAVRLEFTIPTSTVCLVSNVYDFTSKAGKVYGTSVRFLATSGGARTGNNFALNNPSDYVAGASPTSSTFIFVPIQHSGNALGGGTSGSRNALVKFPYSRSGATILPPTAEVLATNVQIGPTYGVAYSRYAKRLFVSAFMKRHSGFGPADGSASAAAYGPGSIYIVNPALNSTTGAASFFISLDKMGYPTHNSTGSPSYASAFTLSSTGSGAARTETVTYNLNGQGVIGTPAERGLPASRTVGSNDPAAFGQIGKVSLGDMEISDDGKYLFVVNLYDRKIYQLLLNSTTSPTGASYVNSWNLPDPPARSASGLAGAATTYASETPGFYNGTVGVQRPFALKYYRGKLYVGSVTTGEGTGAVSTLDDNTGNVEYTDLWSYVWELNPASGFTAAPALQLPLNYVKTGPSTRFDENWKPWTNTMPALSADNANWVFAQPMLTGIEFDVDGSMILSFRDRAGDQGGSENWMLSGSDVRSNISSGDQLRAYKNPLSCGFELESNGKEGSSSPRVATAGANSGNGPGGGEFYYQDGIEMYNGTASGDLTTGHYNTAMGGLALLPGMEEVTATYMDPENLQRNGVSWMNSLYGTNTRDYSVIGGNGTGSTGKSNGLGDIELLFENPPIEIGNRVWKDTDADGIQEAEEPGIAGVVLELVNALGTVIATVTTDADGSWYFSSETGTSAPGITYGVAIDPGTTYTVRLATSGAGNDWDPVANSGAGGPRAGGDLESLLLTGTNKVGNGETDFSDSDAALVSSVPSITLTTGGYGENNHTYDFGFFDRALPVKLIDFNGKADDANQVNLTWTTSEELNSSHFDIQRSADGKGWSNIGKVAAKGESSVTRSYNFTDRSPNRGDNLYRLKMTDRDATFAYSRIVNVKIENVFSLTLFPNPASDKLKITAAGDAAVQKVQVYSLLGKLVQEVIAPKNNELNVQSLASGVYMLKVTTTDGTIETRKIAIAR